MAATGVQPTGDAPAMASSHSTSAGPSAASTCGRCSTTHDAGRCSASSTARSSKGLYSMTRLASMPQEADTTTLGRASSMRMASSCAAKPPKTTECTAPKRAQASMATTASGTMGM
ncbi:MAG TPA: hypothetical protein VEI83_05805 [Acidimicrobiales bacterium]|nr:hypothetical protein [Acidimicrobiales bacterium]